MIEEMAVSFCSALGINKFLLPKPFSKVFLRFGEMIKLKRVKGREIFERQRKKLEEIMLPGLIV